MFVTDIICAFLLTALLTGLYYIGRRGRAGKWAIGVAYGLGVLFAIWLVMPKFSNMHWVEYGVLAVAGATLANLLMKGRSEAVQSPDMTALSNQRTALATCVFFTICALVFVLLIGVRAWLGHT